MSLKWVCVSLCERVSERERRINKCRSAVTAEATSNMRAHDWFHPHKDWDVFHESRRCILNASGCGLRGRCRAKNFYDLLINIKKNATDTKVGRRLKLQVKERRVGSGERWFRLTGVSSAFRRQRFMSEQVLGTDDNINQRTFLFEQTFKAHFKTYMSFDLQISKTTLELLSDTMMPRSPDIFLKIFRRGSTRKTQMLLWTTTASEWARWWL